MNVQYLSFGFLAAVIFNYFFEDLEYNLFQILIKCWIIVVLKSVLKYIPGPTLCWDKKYNKHHISFQPLLRRPVALRLFSQILPSRSLSADRGHNQAHTHTHTRAETLTCILTHKLMAVLSANCCFKAGWDGVPLKCLSSSFLPHMINLFIRNSWTH